MVYAIVIIIVLILGVIMYNAALKGIEAVEEFYRMIEMPTNMKELGINPTDEQIKDMAMKATNHDTQQLGAFKKLSAKDLVEIYKTAK